VLGHEEVMRALRRAMAASSHPHAYLLTGPAGLGKTTMARLIAKEFGAEVNEIDAASNNGVDAMRTLVELGNHAGFGETGIRAFIIDECHRLSRPAFDALLKTLEEPPEHLYLMLCTTELAKVPETIVSRCYHVSLRPLRNNEISDLLTAICALEEWDVKPDVFSAIVQASTGQPRKALSILQSVHDVDSRDEVRRIIHLIDAHDPVIALLQHFCSGKANWKLVQQYMSRLDDSDVDYESVAIQAGRYISTVLEGTEDEAKAQYLWRLLEALVYPAATYDKKVAFSAALGRMLWG
jgi:DNA polymerase III subunit gamma/tau